MGRKPKNEINKPSVSVGENGGGESGGKLPGFLNNDGGNAGEPSETKGRRKKADILAEEARKEILDKVASEKILADLLLVRMDSQLAKTGFPAYKVNDDTRTMLGVQAKTCLTAFGGDKIKPEYVALIMLVITMGQIHISAELQWSAYQKTLKKPKTNQPESQPETV